MSLCFFPCAYSVFGAIVSSIVQLIELYGEDARLFFLQCLVEETGFKEQKAHAHHGNKDAQKVWATLLSTHIAEIAFP